MDERDQPDAASGTSLASLISAAGAAKQKGANAEAIHLFQQAIGEHEGRDLPK